MIAVLPGEDQSAYDRLHRDIIDELRPVGALEKDQVEAIARLTWRKRNFATLHIATHAQRRMANASQPYVVLDMSMLNTVPIPEENV